MSHKGNDEIVDWLTDQGYTQVEGIIKRLPKKIEVGELIYFLTIRQLFLGGEWYAGYETICGNQVFTETSNCSTLPEAVCELETLVQLALDNDKEAIVNK